MKPDKIIEFYEQWDPSQGIESLLEARQHLSIAIVRLGITIGKLEKKHARLYAERKIEKAVKFLEYDSGSAAERAERSTADTRAISFDEATAHGELRGAKIYFDGLCKMADSMASWISRERS